MKQNTFQYTQKQTNITYRGCLFHSLVELKFVLMIEDTHAFLREGLEIYYEESALQSTLYVREQTRKFVPDFLIRDFATKKAMLVEIKPDGFDHYELLAKRKKVCEHFIKQHNYDWQYKVVYNHEIVLNYKQTEKFHQILYSHRNEARLITNNSLIDDRNYRAAKHRVVPYLSDREMTVTEYKYFVRKGVSPSFSS